MNRSPATGGEAAPDLATALRNADSVARRAGVDIRLIDDLSELAEVEALFERIWGPGITVALLRSLVYTGNYVAGAWIQTHLIGASIGFMASDPDRRTLHSFISGVAAGAQGSGVGFALKCHERAWALAHQIERITWYFDPLVRRNASLTLAKLGAFAVAYYENFFGHLNDPLNRWDDTDRCLARWDLIGCDEAGPSPATFEAALAMGAVPILAEGDDHRPTRMHDLPSVAGGGPVLCQVPVDTIALRRSNPNLASVWRSALRDAMGGAMAAGYVAKHFTKDGWYVLEPGP